ncbi:MAG TPA: hypothetical protein VK570_12980 [Rubrivivax sp.]|nr:hypothetical protein [Rubrivivax sp.]
MRDFQSSTIWRVSTFSAELDSPDHGTLPGGLSSDLMSGTLLGALRRLQSDPAETDLLAAVCVCVRQRQSVLLLLEHGPWVWPVSLFPTAGLYYSAHDVADLQALAPLSSLQLIGAVRPSVRDPALGLPPELDTRSRYRPLPALLCSLALHGPRATLLTEISGRAAYRLAARSDNMPALPGALSPVVQRLRGEVASLKDIAGWPGMSVDRASRLLNALYLTSNVMVTRSHPSARHEPSPRDLRLPNGGGRR